MSRTPQQTPRHCWPPDGPHRKLLELLDHLREAAPSGERLSFRRIGEAAGYSDEQVSRILSARGGVRPATSKQVELLVKALGGGDDDVAQANDLFTSMSANRRRRRTTPSRNTLNAREQHRVVHRPALQDRYREIVRGGSAVVALVGAAGTGKTTLAMTLTGPDAYVILCSTDSDVERGMREILSHHQRSMTYTVPQLENALHAHLSAGRRPLILDDIRDPKDLERLIPRDSEAVTVVTTRTRHRILPPEAVIEVGAMSGAEAEELTEILLAEHLAAEQRKILIDGVGNHPLAITAICGRLKQVPGQDIDGLLEDLRHHAPLLLESADESGRPGLAQIYREIYEVLRTKRPRIARLLGMIAYGGSGPLGTRFLTHAFRQPGPAGIPGPQVARAATREALEHLRDLFLIDVSGDDVRMHDLTRTLLREATSDNTEDLVTALRETIMAGLTEAAGANDPRTTIRLASKLVQFAWHHLMGTGAGGRSLYPPIADAFDQYLSAAAATLEAIQVNPRHFVLMAVPDGRDSHGLRFITLGRSEPATFSKADLQMWDPGDGTSVTVKSMKAPCRGPKGPSELSGMLISYDFDGEPAGRTVIVVTHKIS